MNPRSVYAVPAALIALVTMLVLPLPPALLDTLIVVNLAGGAVILLSAISAKRTLDIRSFPSVLLVATLFRLAINVSSSRLILLSGDAGAVIDAFGGFVVGGSLVVGLVVFFILVVIQFVVITQGATRVAEVGARFTLDALPGKQMAIDADLNAGIIDEAQARHRREEISAEAEFYGAMDGASKFVKGDAIAGVVITIINLLGGFAIGILGQGLPVGEAISTYSLLTVGDGLVSQVPALLVSVAAGIVGTRAGTATGDGGIGSDIVAQFGRQTVALRVAGGAMLAFAAVPALPTVPFGLLGITLLVIGQRAAAAADPSRTDGTGPASTAGPDQPDAVEIDPDSPAALYDTIRLEPMLIELGTKLLPLADETAGGDLLRRIKQLRRKIAADLGIVLGAIRVRDSVDVGDRTYRIRLHGVQVGTGDLPDDAVLVIGDNLEALPGTDTTDPVFGLPARWVDRRHRAKAQAYGTVVDRSAVIVTHLTEVLRAAAGDLLSRQDVKLLVEKVAADHPALNDDLEAANVTVGEIHLALTGLLNDGVPVRDIVRILEAIADTARATRDPQAWVEAARAKLGPAVGDAFAINGRLGAITLAPEIEKALVAALSTDVVLSAGDAEAIVSGVANQVAALEARGERPVLVVPAAIRAHLRSLLQGVVPRLPVLSYNEIGAELTVDVIGAVSLAAGTV